MSIGEIGSQCSRCNLKGRLFRSELEPLVGSLAVAALSVCPRTAKAATANEVFEFQTRLAISFGGYARIFEISENFSEALLAMRSASSDISDLYFSSATPSKLTSTFL